MSSPYSLRSRRKQQIESPPPVETTTETVVVKSRVIAETTVTRVVTPLDSGSLTTRHWLGIIAVAALVMLLSTYCSQRLPTPLDPSPANDRFSELRAWPFLEHISAVGPKVSGSDACEVAARRLILDELKAIQDATANSHHRLEIQEQKPSGCYDIPRFDVDGFTICYKNVTNIIARLGDKTRDWKQSQTSVLVNCHFDTWPSSPGASDDLVSCALMMELLRVLTDKQRAAVPVDVVFLFNGAEENVLQASHGFITAHPWRHGIRAFINLEAAGAGGREILFQAGPGNQWLLNAYLEAADHPHCSVLGQEVFESGAIPGDTDFRIFRDHGRIPGLDLAYIQNGYVYHTEFDVPQFIVPGSMQRAGENILSTLTNLLHSPYLEHPADFGDRRFVFYDVIGLFTVVYPLDVGEIINYIVVLIIVAKIASNVGRSGSPLDHDGGYTLRQFLQSVGVHVAASLTALLTTFVLTRVTTLLDLVLTWYSNPVIAFFMYAVPSAAAALYIHDKYVHRLIAPKMERWLAERASFDAHLAILGLIMLVLTFLKIASAFMLLIFALFPLLRDPLLAAVEKVSGHNGCARTLAIVHMICVLPGLLMLIYAIGLVLDIFIPIMGRSLVVANPEVPIAMALTGGSIFFVMMTASLVNRSMRINTLLKVIFVGVLSLYAFLAVSPQGAPYSFDIAAPHPRRVHFTHVHRQVYGKDGRLEIEQNGLMAASYDYRGADDMPQVFDDPAFVPVSCTTSNKFCELPYYFPVADWLPGTAFRFKPLEEKLRAAKTTTITKLSKEYVSPNEIKYSFKLTGSDHITLFITPQEPYHVSDWSFTENKKPEQDRSSFLYLSCVGTDCGRWEFTITISNVDNESVECKGHELLIGAASQFLHGKDMRSRALDEVSAEMERRRTEKGNWRWAMTANIWSADLISRYF
uniref:FXNA-like protease n=1 Tax=Plectus sambesii TaxID=2011161 RepID=A0A914W597_9BILA